MVNRNVVLKTEQSMFDIFKYFPKVPDQPLKGILQINEVGKYSVTRPDEAYQISTAIDMFWKTVLKSKKKFPTILDATAGFGGNSISFGLHFPHVKSVEKDIRHYTMLRSNLRAYNLEKKIQIFHANFLSMLRNNHPAIKSDIIFLDPPWNYPGGIWYTKKRTLMLSLDDIPITKIVSDIFKETSCQAVIIKVPYNFDFRRFMIDCQDIQVTILKIATYYCVFCSKRHHLFLKAASNNNKSV